MSKNPLRRLEDYGQSIILGDLKDYRAQVSAGALPGNT